MNLLLRALLHGSLINSQSLGGNFVPNTSHMPTIPDYPSPLPHTHTPVRTARPFPSAVSVSGCLGTHNHKT